VCVCVCVGYIVITGFYIYIINSGYNHVGDGFRVNPPDRFEFY